MKRIQKNPQQLGAYMLRVLSLVLTMIMILSVFSLVTVSADSDNHIYQQTDSRWASYRYGSGGPNPNTLSWKGCGVLSTINAVEYLTGNFINPKTFADWANRSGQYCKGVGSYNTITKNSVGKFGKEYEYDLDEYYIFSSHVSVNKEGYPKTKSGMTTVWNHLTEKLSDGDTCVGLVKGHFIAIVDYDEDANKVLIYDSAAGTSRGTSASVTATTNWKNMNELWNGSGAGKAKLKLRQMFTFLKVTEESDLDVEDAIEWAVNTANDNSHGYSTKKRNGPDYDCSSFICTAFNDAGFDINCNLTTKTMMDAFKKAGFTVYKKSQASIKRGDILLKPGSNSQLYLGNNQCVSASYDYDGKQGDSSGKEIQVRNKSSCSFCKNKNYTYIIRYV